MTDLEKAQHAASVFANYEFQGIAVWMIEETQTNYQVFGQPSSPIDLDRISHKSKQKYIVNVVGGLGTRYTAEEAYLMARSLERGD
ncbi:hypothetical protein H6G81_23180 [Scytonema hofmannii FACHB-248]|uniref:Uncharacterized protein n=1 Tax=Scytonema hofmannii FACHB-248 TaxID=1842502 RepID=A0ABR8GWB1_9CYAN|nr:MULTISPECIES: hypothetical protein [Nostocales]MBD2607351.1 hypothetical protein [Scytonema hofmannii FACHB-248]